MVMGQRWRSVGDFPTLQGETRGGFSKLRPCPIPTFPLLRFNFPNLLSSFNAQWMVFYLPIIFIVYLNNFMLSEENPRMESLREEIHEIMLANLTPLEVKLQAMSLNTQSVEELFETISEQYKEKQSQVGTMGKLVLHTIDLLTEQVNEKNELVHDYQLTIEDCRREQEDSNLHIQQCQEMLESYKNRIEDLDFEMMQVKELREKYQSMYEEELNTKSVSDTFDCSKIESVELERDDDRHRMEIGSLEYEVKQLKLEVGRKDAQVLRLEQLRNHLNQRIKGETDKNRSMQGNFKILQQNFRALVLENDSLRRMVEDCQEEEGGNGAVSERGEECVCEHSEKEGKGRFCKQNLETQEKEEAESVEEQQLLRRVVSHTSVKRRETEGSVAPAKKSLAFDLQSLYSGISVFSPRASETGKSPRNLFFSNNREKNLALSASKNGQYIDDKHTPIKGSFRDIAVRTRAQFEPVTRRVSPISSDQQPATIVSSPPSFLSRCLKRTLDFLVTSRLRG